MPQYIVVTRCFLDNRLYEEGAVINYSEDPGSVMVPYNGDPRDYDKAIEFLGRLNQQDKIPSIIQKPEPVAEVETEQKPARKPWKRKQVPQEHGSQ